MKAVTAEKTLLVDITHATPCSVHSSDHLFISTAPQLLAKTVVPFHLIRKSLKSLAVLNNFIFFNTLQSQVYINTYVVDL